MFGMPVSMKALQRAVAVFAIVAFSGCASAPRSVVDVSPNPNIRDLGGDLDILLPSGAVRAPGFCNPPEADQFAWPPPQPTDRVRLNPRLFGVKPGEGTSVGEVAEAVRKGFVKVGHVEIGFQSIGCDGFAMISRLERIHSDGRPFDGRLRFLPPDTEEPWSLTGYLRQLLMAPEGKYRQIVILGTDKVFTEFSEPPTTDELDAMIIVADPVAPGLLDTLRWRPEHELVALIYEFERPAGNGAPIKVPPRGIGGTNHLVGAGFLKPRD